MTFASWAVVVGVVLIAMALAASRLRRLPVSAAMLYLGVGVALGPSGLALLRPGSVDDAHALEMLTEAVVIVSLFSVGLKLGARRSRRAWSAPLRLATISMLITVALVCAVGVLWLDLPVGAAVLLGAVLAPTDPVLASDVQLDDPRDRDRLRFALTGEGGMNDGTAFPFVMLGLGLLGAHPLGAGGWRWLAVDVVWAVAGGLAVGAALGAAVGRLVVHLRTRHREAVGRDEFLALGLIGVAYGVAVFLSTYGFLAVFAAGVALRRAGERSGAAGATPAVGVGGLHDPDAHLAAATSPAHAGTYFMDAVAGFTDQLERLAEVGAVMVLGAMLVELGSAGTGALWFVPLLLLVIRPAAVAIGLAGAGATGAERALASWFGIRGVGSLYYLEFAIHRGVPAPLAETLAGLVLATVATSIVVHGVSVTPLMVRHRRGRPVPA